MTEDLFSGNILQTEEEQPQAQTPEQDAPEVAVSSDAGGYTDDAIQTLKWNEHIRRRPGMYIGKLGDGSHPEDGIYVLMKEVLDNSVDEFNMKAGNRIDITLTEEGTVTVRDYGRGIPLGKVKEVASEINTGGKFDDKNFKNGAGRPEGDGAVRPGRPCVADTSHPHRRTQRHTGAVHPGRRPVQRLQVQPGDHRDDGEQLHLPQRGPAADVQRQEVPEPPRLAGPAAREHDLRTPLPHHPP